MEIKGNIVLELKDYLKHNYELKRDENKLIIYVDGKPLDWLIENSIYVDCKTVYPKTTKTLIRAILNSDFVDVL